MSYAPTTTFHGTGDLGFTDLLGIIAIAIMVVMVILITEDIVRRR